MFKGIKRWFAEKKKHKFYWAAHAEDKIYPTSLITKDEEPSNKESFYPVVEDRFEAYRAEFHPDKPKREDSISVFKTIQDSQKWHYKWKKATKKNLKNKTHKFYEVEVNGNIFYADQRHFMEASKYFRLYVIGKISVQQFMKKTDICARNYWEGTDKGVFPHALVIGTIKIIDEVEEPYYKLRAKGVSRFK